MRIDANLLKDGEVQVWRMELPNEPVAEEEYLRTLSSDEIARAGRLRVGRVRMQFLVGRTLVRYLLSREMGIHAGAIRLITGEYGKPEVAPIDGRAVAFNVAHSRSTVLVALCRDGAVGVDVEYMDRQTDVAEVAKHAMTPAERAKLLSIDDTEAQRRSFFRSWTRKEAIVKADGRGLSLPLTSFEVSMEDQPGLSPVAVGALERGVATSYYLQDVMGIPAVWAAVATSFRAEAVVFHDLEQVGFFAWK